MTTIPRRPAGLRSSRSAAVVAAMLTVGLLASACGSSSSDSGDAAPSSAQPEEASLTPTPGGTVVWGLEAETDGLNPISGRWAMSGHMMASAIFDPLVSLDDEGTWTPYLAESLEPNADFTVWTVTLREGVTFHDGTPLTAADVANTLTLHQDSAVTARAVSNMATAEATGPLTVTVTMKEPWSTFPYTLTTQAGYIPAPAMLDDPAEARTPIGTGPFVYQEWDYGKAFRATKNTSYWQEGLPYLDAVEFRPLVDPADRADALLTGDVDAISTITAADITRISETDGFSVLTFNEGEEQFVMFNSGKPPFDNQTARLALARATDAATIRQAIEGDAGVEATSLWAPSQLGASDDDGYLGYNLDAAKQLVAQYQTETGQPLAVTLTAGEDIELRRLQQLLKEQWEAAGAQVELVTVAQADLVVNGALGQYEATLWRNFGHPDPDTEFVWLHSTSIDPSLISLNFAQYADPGVDEALAAGRSTTDEAARSEAYATVARLLNANAPYVWLYRETWAIAARDSVHGYDQAANGSIQTLGAKTWIADLWKES